MNFQICVLPQSACRSPETRKGPLEGRGGKQDLKGGDIVEQECYEERNGTSGG